MLSHLVLPDLTAFIPSEDTSRNMDFDHQFVDAQGGYDEWGAAAVADFDGDGVPEFVTGGRGGGFLHLYDYNGSWCRFEVTHDVSPNVGAAPVDLDGDGLPELVFGEWGAQVLGESRGGKTTSDRYPGASGKRLLWTPMDPARDDFGELHHVGGDFDDPHDVVAGDLDRDGTDEVVVREKEGPLYVYQVPDDPTDAWERERIAEYLPGDGTAIADLTGDGVPDVVTNQGWFENDGEGRFTEHPIPLPDDWDPETRTAVGDVDDDGIPEVVVTESEVDVTARLAVCSHDGDGRAWQTEVVIDEERDRRGLHTLQIADLDGDGRNEIFSAEMENGKTDGQHRIPEWFVLSESDGSWTETVVFDGNLGAHEAKVADFDDDGDLEIVGKIWHPNLPNANGTDHHVSCLDR
jgi:hypothetical protein